MKWIKASERLPEKRYNYFVRCGGFNGSIYNATRMFDPKKIYNTGSNPTNWDTTDEVIEWLDESESPKVEGASIEYLEEAIKANERMVDDLISTRDELRKENERLRGLVEDYENKRIPLP